MWTGMRSSRESWRRNGRRRMRAPPPPKLPRRGGARTRTGRLMRMRCSASSPPPSSPWFSASTTAATAGRSSFRTVIACYRVTRCPLVCVAILCTPSQRSFNLSFLRCGKTHLRASSLRCPLCAYYISCPLVIQHLELPRVHRVLLR